MYDEYYCPNCNATLNNQYGFDPNAGSWTCKRCGTHLFDGTYGGDRFEDVAWYCDSCGAFLNKQAGFTDIYDYWDCTECGHSNPISQDEITNIGSRSSTSNSSSSSGGVLDAVNSILNLVNSIADIAIEHKKARNNALATEENDDEDNDDEEQCKSSQSTTRRSSTKPYLPPKKSPRELKKIRTNAFFWHGKKVQIGFDTHNLLHKNVSEVSRLLHNRAFTNIKEVPVKDIHINTKYAVGEVEQIVIGGSQFFEESDLVPYDTQIIIVHHQKSEIKISFSAESLYGMNYITAGDKLQALGFTQIYERKINDLIFGWLTKDGSVKKVTIAGEEFKKNSIYEYDAEIVIEYHTF